MELNYLKNTNVHQAKHKHNITMLVGHMQGNYSCYLQLLLADLTTYGYRYSMKL